MIRSKARKAFTILAASVALATTAQAQLELNVGWQRFYWDDYGNVLDNFSSFSFSSPEAFTIRIVDGYLAGDRFNLQWTGSGVGALVTFGVLPQDRGLATGATDGDAAWAHPKLSKFSLAFAPGTYEFTLRTLEPYGAGAGFIEASTATSVVPEPSTWALMAAGLAGLFVAGRKRRNARS